VLWGVLVNSAINTENVGKSDKCHEQISFLLLIEQFKTGLFMHYILPAALSNVHNLNIDLE
jgi:hypothetical protein